MEKLILGIDIGGTKILTGLLTPDGRIVDRIRENTGPSASPEDALDRIALTIDTLLGRNGISVKDLAGCAAGSPGPIHFKSGTLIQTPNLNWDGLKLRDELSKRMGRPVILDNDANMAALGEYYFGNTRGCRHLLYMTVSTGIGGGLILDGEVYRGTAGGAGEFGHMILQTTGDCACGGKGCLETLASGTALAKKAQALVQSGRGRGILQVSHGQEITARSVGEAVRQGDPEAAEILHEAVKYLGMAIGSLINIFNPGRVILGGGVSLGMADLILEPVRNFTAGQVFRLHRESVQIEITTLGENNGLLGCAAAVLKEAEKKR